MEVTLGFFTGREWVLRGCDYGGPGKLRIALNDVVYLVYEDENDGYRSHMKNIICIPRPTKVDLPTNMFEPVPVYARMSHLADQDIVQFIDKANGKLIIEFGTDRTDDYYPSCRAYFDPTALSVNRPLKDPEIGGIDFRKRRIRPKRPETRPEHPTRQRLRRRRG